MDAAVEFQPINKEGFDRRDVLGKLCKKILKKELTSAVFSYSAYVKFQLYKTTNISYKRYPSCCPQWDNSPRRVGRPFTGFKGSTPSLFKKWFFAVYNRFKPYSKDENFIFINAWNEWAEGCHLEPDLKFGRAYLEAVKEVVNK